jgi:hypothetical protein
LQGVILSREKLLKTYAFGCEMKTKIHNEIAKLLLRNLDPKTIEKINKMIDNPEPWMPRISPLLGMFPGLHYGAHRIRGHDLATSIWIGFREARCPGVATVIVQIGLDASRDQLVKLYGVEVADIAKATLMICIIYYKASRAFGNKGYKR